MSSILDDQNPSEDIIKMPEIVPIRRTSNQPLTTSTTMEDMTIPIRFNDSIYRIDDIQAIIDQKQKSLVSIYDNNSQQQSPTSLVGIIGRNKRSQAFTKRLLLSGFPKPILCDVNSTEIDSNYVSYETFYQYSPTIILITDNLTANFEDLFPQNKHQLIIDTREMSTPLLTSSIPGSYRAFGNLSNWEIENGTERIGVAIEQYSPSNLIKFIADLQCFSLNQSFYYNQSRKSFRNCLFPFISTILIFTFWLILSIIEHHQKIYDSKLIYRQASSITAATSLTLLAVLFLIRPLVELMEFIYSIILKNDNILSNLPFIQRCLQSRGYLSWYSLSFALLHLLFLIFSELNFDSNLSIYAFFIGILALILLFILSFIHFPWISERLLWNEYHFFSFYLGPLTLLLAFLHLCFYWNLQTNLFNLKFLSMIFPATVLILYLIIYGILRPIQWIQTRSSQNNIT